MFRIVKSYTHSTTKKNEDCCYICSHYGFVIDGASGLDSFNIIDDISDAAWFSNFIGKELRVALSQDYDVYKALIVAVDKAKEYYYKALGDREVLPHQMPSASIAIFRITGDILEYLQLGDCTGAIFFNDRSVKLIAEEKHTNLDQKVIAQAVEISKEQNITVKEAMNTTEIREHLIKNREKKNKENGYWILDITGDGIACSKVYKFNAYVVKSIMCCSDGFAQVVDGFKIHSTYRELLKALQSASPEVIAQELFLCQDKDPDFSVHPRFKHSDDTSIIYGEM